MSSVQETHKKPITDKKVQMRLAGMDGNAHVLLGAFSREARHQGWDESLIDQVVKEAMSGDYNHLLRTLVTYTETPDELDEDDTD